MSILEFKGVTHRYGHTLALDDFYLGIHKGEITCLLGPSGCGKTTVLRLAAGLETLQSGAILLDGKVIADTSKSLSPENRNVGLVFQDYALFPHLTIFENVAYGVKNVKGKEKNQFVNDAIDRLGLSGVSGKYPHMLSGGQQSRVALARALATNPHLMLLDEPFSSLDVNLRRNVRDQTLHVLKASGAASLLVTHDPEEAMFLADRIVLMDKGKVVQAGTPSELYFRPVNAFSASFFGEINHFEGVVDKGQAVCSVGKFGAETFAEGEDVDILIRSEAISIVPFVQNTSKTPRAVVMTSRFLGRTSLVHLSLETQEGRHYHIHVRRPGRFIPKKGQVFDLEIDPTLVFVFVRPPGRKLENYTDSLSKMPLNME